MKMVKFLLKAIVIIFAMVCSMGMGAEFYRSSPDFRRGFDKGRETGFHSVTKSNKDRVGFKNYVTVKGIGY